MSGIKKWIRWLSWIWVWCIAILVIIITQYVIPSILFIYTPFQIEKDIVYTIPSGTNASEIIANLANTLKLSPEDERKMYWFVRMSGYSKGLKSGEYAIFPFSTPKSLMERIFRGEVIRYVVTIPEGSTVYDVAELVQASGLATKDDIIELAFDPSFAHSLGIRSDVLEGYLFPDTYTFTRLDNTQTILKTMVRTFQKQFLPEWEKRADKLGLTVHEIVTLASIIEKEAIFNEERPIIAGVFYNRLKRDMPLQSDPTTVYDIPFFKGTITKSHLSRPSPYNTYLIKGLPPSPICSPGIPSIKAALYPKDVPYLYFVSQGSGRHIFSTTYKNHLMAIRGIRSRGTESEKVESSEEITEGNNNEYSIVDEY